MKMKKLILFFLTLYSTNLLCQEGAQIFKQLKKLNTLASVLYVAAHPDDENTRLISLFSNHFNARTAYLSLTRGDGGQNLIGTELREGLGLIRTQELIEARKIDGGEQFFTTANDFGFSKHPKETLSIWNEKEILSQIVFRFRQFLLEINLKLFFMLYSFRIVIGLFFTKIGELSAKSKNDLSSITSTSTTVFSI